jgi:hypothetical protein
VIFLCLILNKFGDIEGDLYAHNIEKLDSIIFVCINCNGCGLLSP